MFGMFQSVTTNSKPPVELLQSHRAVLGFIDVGETEFLQQIPDDAPHRREIVYHENPHLGISHH
jgi:hypothetical protein